MESDSEAAASTSERHIMRNEIIDTDAFDFLHVPVWYERHPSQAEGEDH